MAFPKQPKWLTSTEVFKFSLGEVPPCLSCNRLPPGLLMKPRGWQQGPQQIDVENLNAVGCINFPGQSQVECYYIAIGRPMGRNHRVYAVWFSEPPSRMEQETVVHTWLRTMFGEANPHTNLLVAFEPGRVQVVERNTGDVYTLYTTPYNSLEDLLDENGGVGVCGGDGDYHVVCNIRGWLQLAHNVVAADGLHLPKHWCGEVLTAYNDGGCAILFSSMDPRMAGSIGELSDVVDVYWDGDAVQLYPGEPYDELEIYDGHQYWAHLALGNRLPEGIPRFEVVCRDLDPYTGLLAQHALHLETIQQIALGTQPGRSNRYVPGRHLEAGLGFTPKEIEELQRLRSSIPGPRFNYYPKIADDVLAMQNWLDSNRDQISTFIPLWEKRSKAITPEQLCGFHFSAESQKAAYRELPRAMPITIRASPAFQDGVKAIVDRLFQPVWRLMGPEQTCGICLQAFESPKSHTGGHPVNCVTLQCGHWFCLTRRSDKTCEGLFHWMAENSSCPTCRLPIQRAPAKVEEEYYGDEE